MNTDPHLRQAFVQRYGTRVGLLLLRQGYETFEAVETASNLDLLELPGFGLKALFTVERARMENAS